MKAKFAFPVMLATLLLTCARAGQATEPAPPPNLLLRYQFTFNLFELGSVSETLIYRDGLVISIGKYTGSLDLAFIDRGLAPPTALKTLRTILAEKRVDVQAANCIMLVNNFPPEAEFEVALTWFGRNGRQKRLTFANSGFDDTEECNREVESIFLAVESFLRAVPDSDRVQTLP